MPLACSRKPPEFIGLSIGVPTLTVQTRASAAENEHFRDSAWHRLSSEGTRNPSKASYLGILVISGLVEPR